MDTKYRRMLRVMEEKAPRRRRKGGPTWSLYILRCGDGSLYTGVTTDVDRRVGEHQAGTGARYTRTHLPVTLVYREECGDRARSLTRECAVKSLPRARKDALIAGETAPPPRVRRKPRSRRGEKVTDA